MHPRLVAHLDRQRQAGECGSDAGNDTVLGFVGEVALIEIKQVDIPDAVTRRLSGQLVPDGCCRARQTRSASPAGKGFVPRPALHGSAHSQTRYRETPLVAFRKAARNSADGPSLLWRAICQLPATLLRSQHAARLLADILDDAARPAPRNPRRSASCRPAGSTTSMAIDFLPSPSAAPSNTSNTETPVISLRSAAAAARVSAPASTALSTTKAKSRFTAWNGDSSSFGLVRVGFAFGSGIASTKTSKPQAGRRRRAPPASWDGTRRNAEHRLRPELDRAGAARMIPGRAAGLDLQPVDRRAARFERGEARRPWRRTRRPGRHCRPSGGRRLRAWPCRAARRRRRAAGCRARRPHRFPTLRTARRRRCPCRHCAGRPRAAPAAATAACRTCRRRSGWRASASAGRRRTASACSAGMNDQVTASIMPRTASARLAARVRICSVVRILPLTASWLASGCGAMLSTPWMRMTSSTRSALPSMSGRQDGTATSTTSPESLRREAEPRQDVEAFLAGHVEAGQPLHFRQSGR